MQEKQIVKGNQTSITRGEEKMSVQEQTGEIIGPNTLKVEHHVSMIKKEDTCIKWIQARSDKNRNLSHFLHLLPHF